MRLEITETLSNEIRAAIEELLNACRAYEGLTLSFPYEEVTSTFLLWDDEASEGSGLLAVLGLLLPFGLHPEFDISPDPEEPAELCAFTLPSRRRQGLFSRLFAAAEEHFADRDLLFLLDHHSPDAIAAAEHLGAEPDGNEYRMEYEFRELPDFSLLDLPASPRLSLSAVTEDSDTTRYEFFLPGEKTAAALCRTRAFESRVCFYDFSVRESLRGQGLGKEAFLLVLAALKEHGCTGIFLHVSGDNLPAVSLYQKTGFRICETLSYYLY